MTRPEQSEEAGGDALKVSVLVLTWNHELYIRDCLESILGQDFRNLQLICCDNGSSDGTWSEIEAVRKSHPDRDIVVSRNPPGTPVNVGFNGMMATADGDLMCLFSGDDLFTAGRVRKQVELFEERPALEIVYANGAFLGGPEDGKSVHDDSRCGDVFEKDVDTVLAHIFSNRGMMIQTFMARTSLIKSIGGFDEGSIADDWILNIRIFRHLEDKSQYAYMPFVAFLYRQHDNNAYKDFNRQSRLMIEVIDKYYDFPDRRRELAEMYYFQVHVSTIYGFKHLPLTAKYLAKALSYEIRPRELKLLPLRVFWGIERQVKGWVKRGR